MTPPPSLPQALTAKPVNPLVLSAPEEPDDVEDVTSLGDLFNSDLSGPTIPDTLQSLDSASTILGPNPESWDTLILSQVLKDIWHIFHMFYISVKHGLHKQFTWELRDAFFIPDKTNKQWINAWGST